jgi:hypothetical protein
METREITVRVTPEAARIYQSATAEERRKLELLVSLRLCEAAQPNRSLREIMQEASQEAAAAGLTPDLLQAMLDAP